MNAFQIKIVLENTHPPIWRRVIIPEGLTFSQLSVVLNIVMGWDGSHLCDFSFFKPRSIIAESGIDDKGKVAAAESTYINSYMYPPVWFRYTYDFGDEWVHRVTVEAIVENYRYGYPKVIKIKGTCPPENCGGVYQFQELRVHKGMDSEALCDGEKVNEILKQRCYIVLGKKEKRNAAEIYQDFEHKKYGLFAEMKPVEEGPMFDERMADPEFVERLMQKMKKLTDGAERTISIPYTLEQYLNVLTKNELQILAGTKNITFRLSDIKKILKENIKAVMADTHTIEKYIYCMDDAEVASIQRVIDSQGPYFEQPDDDFSILAMGEYIDVDWHYGILIPDEVIQVFQRVVHPINQRKRGQYVWLLKCIDTANLLYAITPLAILMKLCNQSKQFKINVIELVRGIHDLLPEVCSVVLEQGTMYMTEILPYKKELMETQAHKDFYIPTTSEISQGVYNMIWFADPDDVFDAVEFLVDVKNLEYDEAYQQIRNIVILIAQGYQVKDIMERLHAKQFRFDKQHAREFLFLIMRLMDTTRLQAHRGFTIKEITR